MALITLKRDKMQADTSTARGRLAEAIEAHRTARTASARAALALDTAEQHVRLSTTALAEAKQALEAAQHEHADKVIGAALSHGVLPAASLREQRLALGDAEDDLVAAKIAVERLRGPAAEAEEAAHSAAFQVTQAASEVISEQAIAFLRDTLALQNELIRARLTARWLLQNGLLPQGTETAGILNELRLNSRLPTVEAGPFGEPDMLGWRNVDPAPSLEAMRNALEQDAGTKIVFDRTPPP